jgi:hypothetical protein
LLRSEVRIKGIHPFQQGIVQLEDKVKVIDPLLPEHFCGSEETGVPGLPIITRLVVEKVLEKTNSLNTA